MGKIDPNSTWVKALDPNFLNADLIGPPGTELIVTIDHAEDDVDCIDPNSSRGDKKKVKAIFFKEDVKPVVLNATKMKALNRIFGPVLGDCYGKKIVLKCEIIKAFGKNTTSIQIHEYNDIPCQMCKEPIQPTKRMTVSDVISYSKRNCSGKVLCMACMTKLAKENKQNE